MNNLEIAILFKALCDENRVTIMELLKSGEKCACILLEELQIGQSTLSHHMKILCDSKMVVSRKEGKWTYYSVNENKIEEATHYLTTFSTSKKDKKCLCK
ncbi:ArsR/SmtB family transcription factor [Anaerorhabdus sp.]|uniref:ArsR/SmtB family transcription factor n=1 Tax=Anaerorhabdus sp. TaxID=1872524 RepID=UPI002FC994DE